MDRSRLSLVTIILLLLVGCSSRDKTAAETPTPFTAAGTTPRAPVGEPITISLANLAANPETFEGSNLELRGQYQPQPLLICESDPFPSPATWSIVADGLVANASGQDQQLRQLLEEGQNITAVGRWLRYTGPVGCGKSAPEQEVWYLSLSRITDPHPLARATSLLDIVPPGGTVIAEIPTAETEAATEEADDLMQPATVPPTATEVLPPAGPSPLPPTATPTLDPNPAATSSPTLTAVPGRETATLTATPTISTTTTVTPTPDGSITPTATNIPSDGDLIDKGSIDFEDLVMSNLGNGAVHSWNIELEVSDFLTITVAPAVSANMAISVIDPNGQMLVDKQNQSPAGDVETITSLSVEDTGTYKIQVSSEPAEAANYAMMVLDSTSYPFEFRGTLNPGEQRSDNLPADTDFFWFFTAADGETITIQVTPNGDADAYVELYGPDAARRLTIDEALGGSVELLSDYSILETGMYAIRVGEFDFEEMIYQIELNKS